MIIDAIYFGLFLAIVATILTIIVINKIQKIKCKLLKMVVILLPYAITILLAMIFIKSSDKTLINTNSEYVITDIDKECICGVKISMDDTIYKRESVIIYLNKLYFGNNVLKTNRAIINDKNDNTIIKEESYYLYKLGPIKVKSENIYEFYTVRLSQEQYTLLKDRKYK